MGAIDHAWRIIRLYLDYDTIPYLHHDVLPVLVLHQQLHDHVDDAPHVVRAQGDLDSHVMHGIQPNRKQHDHVFESR